MSTQTKKQMTKQEITNQIVESTNTPELNINKIMGMIKDLTFDEQMEVFASVVQFDINTRIWDKYSNKTLNQRVNLIRKSKLFLALRQIEISVNKNY